MGNSASTDDMTKKQLCIGRSHHKTTYDIVEQRNHANPNHKTTVDTAEKLNHVNPNEAKGNVPTSERVAEATVVNVSQTTGDNSSSKPRNEEIVKDKDNDDDASDEGVESAPDESDENPSSESVTGESKKSGEDELSEYTLTSDTSEDSKVNSVAETVKDKSVEKQTVDDKSVEKQTVDDKSVEKQTVDDKSADYERTKEQTVEVEIEDRVISNSEGQYHGTDDVNSVFASDDARRDEGNATAKEHESVEKDADRGYLDAVETPSEEKKQRKINAILCRFITRVRNTTLRRKQENKLTAEPGTEIPSNMIESTLMSDNTGDKKPVGEIEVKAHAPAEDGNTDTSTKKKRILKNFFSRLKKGNLFLKGQKREGKQNVNRRKKKLKFLTFISRIKEVERHKRSKDDSSISNGSSDSEIFTDITIQGGHKKTESSKTEHKSNLVTESSKDGCEREQMEEKEQWRWEAEECLGGATLRKRR